MGEYCKQQYDFLSHSLLLVYTGCITNFYIPSLTASYSLNCRYETDSQIEFFKMLDKKIEGVSFKMHIYPFVISGKGISLSLKLLLGARGYAIQCTFLLLRHARLYFYTHNYYYRARTMTPANIDCTARYLQATPLL